jgi:hypothetical protein
MGMVSGRAFIVDIAPPREQK